MGCRQYDSPPPAAPLGDTISFTCRVRVYPYYPVLYPYYPVLYPCVHNIIHMPGSIVFFLIQAYGQYALKPKAQAKP